LLAVLVFASVGCAGRAHIESRKRADFDKKLDRVLIVFDHDRLGRSFMEAFKKRFAAELRSRGVESRYAITSGALDVESAPSLEKQAKDFRASSILALAPAGGTVNQYGALRDAKLDGKILDVAMGKLVWRAQISYTPGDPMFPAEQRAYVLIYEILTALVADGLVAGPPPPSPDAPPATAASGTVDQ